MYRFPSHLKLLGAVSFLLVAPLLGCSKSGGSSSGSGGAGGDSASGQGGGGEGGGQQGGGVAGNPGMGGASNTGGATSTGGMANTGGAGGTNSGGTSPMEMGVDETAATQYSIKVKDVLIQGAGFRENTAASNCCCGSNNNNAWYLPNPLTVKFGWNHVHEQLKPVRLWIDDIAVSEKPIGCPK